MNVRITEFEVSGPAAELGVGAGRDAGFDTGNPNRIGSERVPVRAYEPLGAARGTLVWAHGGSFVRGTLDWPEADWVARRFAEAGFRVYSVDYVLASDEVKAPAPANDVAAVLRWAAASHEGPLIIGGASAGGNLAVQAALQQASLRGAAHAESATSRAADAMLLVYPTLHRRQREDPAIAGLVAGLGERRRFRPARVAEMYDYYLGADTGAAAGTETCAGAGADIGAGAGSDTGAIVVGELPTAALAELPPTIIVNAELDDLRASGEQFAEQLAVAGVRVVEFTQAGAVHGFLNRADSDPSELAQSQETIASFVAELGRMCEG